MRLNGEEIDTSNNGVNLDDKSTKQKKLDKLLKVNKNKPTNQDNSRILSIMIIIGFIFTLIFILLMIVNLIMFGVYKRFFKINQYLNYIIQRQSSSIHRIFLRHIYNV